MRTLLFVAVAAWSFSAQAQQAISGTITSHLDSVDMFGQPTVTINLDLACSLSCPMSAPTLHLGVAGGVNARFISATTESSAYIGAFFGSDPSGHNTLTTTNFKSGTANSILAKSCTCWCGNATGQGGYVDLETQLVIPPFLYEGYTHLNDASSYVVVYARPWGGEKVDVSITGAGVNLTQSLGQTDYAGRDSYQVHYQATQPGTLTVTATLQPYGSTTTKTITIAGSGSGGGSGSTGGGAGGGSASGGGGGGAEEDPGCSTTGVWPLALLALVWLRRW